MEKRSIMLGAKVGEASSLAMRSSRKEADLYLCPKWIDAARLLIDAMDRGSFQWPPEEPKKKTPRVEKEYSFGEVEVISC